MGTNFFFTLQSCGSCGLPFVKTCLCRVYPNLLTPVRTEYSENTLQTSTAVATASGMVLYEHIKDSQGQVVSTLHYIRA